VPLGGPKRRTFWFPFKRDMLAENATVKSTYLSNRADHSATTHSHMAGSSRKLTDLRDSAMTLPELLYRSSSQT
jgi:hypothetical protein